MADAHRLAGVGVQGGEGKKKWTDVSEGRTATLSNVLSRLTHHTLYKVAVKVHYKSEGDSQSEAYLHLTL